ncbi:hypothetical protein [Streptomyces qinglanensis]|uniref:hypothetical protein n=1 Tax=Streptomyces qinglanensis TaxID=943816 RepID=UPI0009429828|nr:hypothetical protein [Streptomyces qinglanensis]
MLVYVVCAGSRDEAVAWSRMHDIPQQRCRYASSTRVIEGVRDFVVVRLRGFFDRSDREEIEACLRRNEMKMPSPLVRRDERGS